MHPIRAVVGAVTHDTWQPHPDYLEHASYEDLAHTAAKRQSQVAKVSPPAIGLLGGGVGLAIERGALHSPEAAKGVVAGAVGSYAIAKHVHNNPNYQARGQVKQYKKLLSLRSQDRLSSMHNRAAPGPNGGV